MPENSHSSLTWKSSFETHEYNPLYLANSHFGGIVEVSGTDMCLWSSSIVGRDIKGADHDPLYPVTALRTRVFYQDTPHKAQKIFLGRSGIITNDPSYTSDPSIPHLPQVYRCEQKLDIETGTAVTKGTLYTGSQANLEASPDNPRAIPYESTKAFLLGSPYAQFIISSRSSVEITFTLESILEEHFSGNIDGRGIYAWGSTPMNCDMQFKKSIIRKDISPQCIRITLQPEGVVECYQVIATTGTGSTTEFLGSPAFRATGSLDVRICILRNNQPEAPEISALSNDAFLAEQARRWRCIKQQTLIKLPESERFWQIRYETHLFQVVQSIGYGPTHPAGLSKPYLPYWFGNFHDTDTYLCRPLLERGHFDIAHQNLDYRHRTLQKAYTNAEQLDRSGAQYPWQCDPEGTGANDDIIMNHAIIACEAWYQFSYSQNQFAGAKAADIISGIFENLADHIDFEGGVATLKDHPLATFSETMEVSHPNEAILGIRAVSRRLIDANAAGFKISSENLSKAEKILKDVQLYTREDGSYRYSKKLEPEYTRCPSVMLGAFPIHELPADERLRKCFETEMSKILFLFSWLPHQASIVASQLQIKEGPQSAVEILRQADAHYRNFHAVDEWENRRVGRPPLFVTGSGGFCSAIHNILVSETAPNTWTLFPAVPSDWKDLSFENIVLRNGWKVSARMENGKITDFCTEAPTNGYGERPTFTNAPR